MSRAQRTVLARAAVTAIAVFAAFSCASLPPESIQREQGYYYGIGSGPSAADAAEAARRDLIASALTASRDRGGRGARVEIGAEAARAFPLPRLRPYAQNKTPASVSIAYRLKIADWDRAEARREAAIRAEIAPRVAALEAGADRPLSGRMLEAARMLERLRLEGLTELLTENGPGSPLVSARIESICGGLTDNLSFAVDPRDGFVGPDAQFSLRGAGAGGGPLPSLPIRAEWSAAEVEPLVVTATTGPDGKARLDFPKAEVFRNRAVRLTISTNFAPTAPASKGLKEIDARSAVEYRYRHFDDAAACFAAEARVPGGPFTAGALSRDRRAARKEAPRPATTVELLIDRYPVTNALYAMFLEDTGSRSFPQYWDHPAYNQPHQPVIGVTWADANRFAAWLSGRLGVSKRLPTEDEWEKAARGGLDVIYPWGDQSPAEGTRANYRGNGRFAGPSPVGSYETGTNGYGMADMAGNVWQWTSTPYAPAQGSAADGAAIIVKGGSWMDGPTDLRISNRRDLDPSKGYVDVGFRLVREVPNE